MNSSKNQPVLITILLVGMLILAFFIMLPYLTAIILAMVLAIVCEPLYLRIKKVVRINWIASLAMTLCVLIIFLLPLSFFGTLVFNEARDMYIGSIEGADLDTVGGLPSLVQQYVARHIPTLAGTLDVAQYTQDVLAWVVQNVGGVFSSIVQGVVTFALSLFIFFYFLKDQKLFEQFLSRFSPLTEENTNKIVDKIKRSVNSVVGGSLVVAVLQGIVTGCGFALFGIPNPALWGGIAVVAALVPTFGTSLVVVPAIVYLFANHHIGAAIGLLAWGFLAVGMLDNFLGPQLVKRGTKVHPLIVLLSVLGGVGIFGPIGFIMGPLVFSLLFALLEMYRETWHEEARHTI
ncbi:MAG: AI-2E family transporter [Candidatus Pacebacteria bacterium]|nr:AI-2E family transporter [Candidatus Paceibacterota bacterium]